MERDTQKGLSKAIKQERGRCSIQKERNRMRQSKCTNM